MTLDRIDFLILSIMKDRTTENSGSTSKEIEQMMKDKYQDKYKIPKQQQLKRRIRKLVKVGGLSEGLKSSNEKTYIKGSGE